MNILTTSTEAQILRVIPRVYASNVTVYIIDENTKVSNSYSVTTSLLNGYMEISLTLSLIEGRFYTLEVKDASNVLFRGRILCTDQIDLARYDMNLNGYATSNDKSDIITI